jgi:hypothetical protein
LVAGFVFATSPIMRDECFYGAGHAVLFALRHVARISVSYLCFTGVNKAWVAGSVRSDGIMLEKPV